MSCAKCGTIDCECEMLGVPSEDREYSTEPGHVYFSGVAIPRDEYDKLQAEVKELRSLVREALGNEVISFDWEERAKKLLGDVK